MTPILRSSNKEHQILEYLYALKDTPTAGVGPDFRLTIVGIFEGTQMPARDVSRQLDKLIEKALVRSFQIGFNLYYSITIKGRNEVEKIQHKMVKVEFGNEGFKLGLKKSETKGKKPG